MLDTESHQAAGLAVLACEQEPRVIALASHGDRRSELPLLWQLCSAWTQLDYPVIVLDGHVQETNQQPGLLQLLQEPDESAILARAGKESDWPIISASLGLREMGRNPGLADAVPGLAAAAGSLADAGASRAGSAFASALCRVLPGYELIVVYAPAQELAHSMASSGASPLLPVSADASALISAYQALKQLLNVGRLRPTIITVMDNSTLSARVSGHSIGRNLQDCARDFLACEVPALTIDPNRHEELQGLALRALEQAARPDATLSAMTAVRTPRDDSGATKRH